MAVITLRGIDEAITNLGYRNKMALKCRLVQAIRAYYEREGSTETLQSIDANELIKTLWHTGNDSTATKNRKKNLSALRSLVNADLKKLYEKGRNPEGITITPSYIFGMSEEAKEQVLKSFTDMAGSGDAPGFERIRDVLGVVNEVLASAGTLSQAGGADGASKIDELRKLIQGLSEKLGFRLMEAAGENAPESPGTPGLVTGESSAPFGEKLILSETEDPHALEEIEPPAENDESLVEEYAEQDEVDAGEETSEYGEFEQVIETNDTLEKQDAEEEFEELEVDDDVEVDETENENEVIELVEDGGIGGPAEGLATDEEDAFEEIGGDDGFEEADLLEEDEETVPAVDTLQEGEDFDIALAGDDKITKAKILAEEFDSLLSVRDKYYNQYVLIPEGEYVVGSRASKGDERPERKVRLQAFYMGRFPVTNALFQIFVEKTGYRTTAEKFGYGTVYFSQSKRTMDEKTGQEKFVWNASLASKVVAGACWYQPLGPGSSIHNKSNHPVVQVSLEDAMAFAAWTGKKLPTEDEWEAASRTAMGYIFPWGNKWKKNSCNIGESNVGGTTPVDRYIKFENKFGIADTIGNVLEWTMTHSHDPYRSHRAPRSFVAKGGSWLSGNSICLYSRFRLGPESFSNILGFRCVAY